MHALRLILRPRAQTTFALKPTILYLDENGKYKSHELETFLIFVIELGNRVGSKETDDLTASSVHPPSASKIYL